MDTSIHSNRIELIQWLTTVEDNTVLEKLLDFKKKATKDWWDDLSEPERNSIQKGIEDAGNGKLIAHKEVRKVYEKWL